MESEKVNRSDPSERRISVIAAATKAGINPFSSGAAVTRVKVYFPIAVTELTVDGLIGKAEVAVLIFEAPILSRPNCLIHRAVFRCGEAFSVGVHFGYPPSIPIRAITDGEVHSDLRKCEVRVLLKECGGDVCHD